MGSGEDRETAVRCERSNRWPRARGSADGEGSSLGEASVLPDLQGVVPMGTSGSPTFEHHLHPSNFAVAGR